MKGIFECISDRFTVKRVGYGEILVRLEDGRVGDAGLVLVVVVELVPAQIPAPRLVVAAHQTLSTERAKTP